MSARGSLGFVWYYSGYNAEEQERAQGLYALPALFLGNILVYDEIAQNSI